MQQTCQKELSLEDDETLDITGKRKGSYRGALVPQLQHIDAGTNQLINCVYVSNTLNPQRMFHISTFRPLERFSHGSDVTIVAIPAERH